MFKKVWHDWWIGIFILLIFIGIFSGRSLVIGFGVMGLLVAGISWIWNELSLRELNYKRIMSQNRIFKGESVSLTIELSNMKPIPLSRIDIDDDIPEDLEIAGTELLHSPNPKTMKMRHSTSLSWYEKVRWEYRLTGTKRGYFKLGPSSITSGDVFGLFDCFEKRDSDDYVLVYPTVVSLPNIGLPELRPLGEMENGIRMFHDPSRPSGIRDYQDGDPMKTIDWKSTARSTTLKVRTFEPSSSHTVILIVAIETALRFWEGYSVANLERIITAASSIASYCADKGYSIGFFSNGTPILSDRPMDVPASSSVDQLMIILEVLATIRPLPMGSMTENLSTSSKTFPTGSTLVITAALMTDDFVGIITRLHHMGYKIVVLYVADDGCPLLPEGVLLYEIGAHFESMEQRGEFVSR